MDAALCKLLLMEWIIVAKGMWEGDWLHGGGNMWIGSGSQKAWGSVEILHTHRDTIYKNKMNLNTSIYVSRLTGYYHHRHGLDNEWVWSQIRKNSLNWNSLGTQSRGHLFSPASSPGSGLPFGQHQGQQRRKKPKHITSRTGYISEGHTCYFSFANLLD